MAAVHIHTSRLPSHLLHQRRQQRLLHQLQRIAAREPATVLAALDQAERDQMAETRRIAR